MTQTPLLSLRDITTWFAENGVLANDAVSVELRAGEVHALVGENGAGKSTLMHVISGFQHPTSGTILLNGAPVAFASPSEAIRLGIVMVHQHPPHVPGFRVWENLLLGIEQTDRLGLLDRRKAFSVIMETARRFGFPVDPGARMDRLAASQIHFAAILGALLRHPRLLILDEPTGPCTESEVALLFRILRSLVADGVGVILITHKLKEVMEIADLVTVMRGGAIVATLQRRKTTAIEIASLMLGEDCQVNDLDRRVVPVTRPAVPQPPQHIGQSRLELRAVSVFAGDLPVLDRIDLSADAGSILGITGIRENGLEFLEDVLSGTISPDEGEILLDGVPVSRYTPRHFRHIGISYIPTDRILRGASMDSTMAENLILLHRKRLQSGGFLRRKTIDRFAEGLKHRYGITGVLHQPMKRLSGGNIQKVILSRELSGRRKVVVFSEPSWGLDIRARDLIYSEMHQLRDEGAVVVLISADIDEILSLADRIVVMYRGRVAATLQSDDRTRERIGEFMLGVEQKRGEATR